MRHMTAITGATATWTRLTKRGHVARTAHGCQGLCLSQRERLQTTSIGSAEAPKR